MDKSKLLDQCGALGEDRTLLARVLDRAKQASERNIPAATDFLQPERTHGFCAVFVNFVRKTRGFALKIGVIPG